MDLKEKYHLIHLSKGNKDSFVFIHRKYQSRIYQFCLNLVRTREVAQEITSDVFVKLWEKRAIVKANRPISGLLLKIVKDLSISHLRKVSRDATLRKAYVDQYFENLRSPVEEQLFVKEGLHMATQAIEALPPRCRQVFRLRYFQDLSLMQIAEELNISTNTVQNHLQKGTRIVKAQLRANSDLVFILIVGYLI